MTERLSGLLDAVTDLPANELHRVVTAAGRALGAERARLLVADYAFTWLHELGEDGPVGEREAIEGSLSGLAMISGDVVVSNREPGRVWVPVSEGSERLGVLELFHRSWADVNHDDLSAVVGALTLVLVSKRRYSDVIIRARRDEPLSIAAELQWSLLPPLTCSTDRVSVSGILEPAYSNGGDSFDYALNADRLEFAIIDAVGHGMAAVMISVLAINSLRNARREGLGLETAYHQTDHALATQFGDCAFVTAQIGSIELNTGELRWLNAGHPPPLLVRDATLVGELVCRPSPPMGLEGSVSEVASEQLQRGDRLLFFTDGVTEQRAPDGGRFGLDRLADHLMQATHEGVDPAETVRRLKSSIMQYNGVGLSDDATLLLVDFHSRTSHS